MAEVYLAMNEHQKSIEMYEKILKAEPNDRAHAGIAANLIKMGEYEKARNQLHRGLKNYYYSLAIHLNLAILNIIEGDINNTLKILGEINDLLDQGSLMRLFVGNQFSIAEVLFETGKTDEAMERLAIGKKLMEEADFTEGERDLLLLHYLSHAVCLEIKKGNVDEAKKYFEIYNKNIDINIESSFKKVWLWQKWQYALSGLINYTQGKYDQAIDDLKRSDGQDLGPNYFVSWAYQKQEPWTNYYLALSYLKIGDIKKAIEKLESVVNYYGFPSLTAEIYRRRAQEHLAVLKAGE
jgi:tetratricopeptide (TPR) repeat protein